ncbi:MAG TPA: helix-turn-helix transcriptional regulator [Allosphingosinicella sp.]|nr:helix-turn-helix transcriptional regulator [Allosphingosinicella sp.]
MRNPEIGERIAELRKARGIKGAELARLVGVSRAAVHAWETGSCPRADALEAVARIFAVTPDFLRTGQAGGEPTPAAEARIAEILESARAKLASATGIPPERIRVEAWAEGRPLHSRGARGAGPGGLPGGGR